MIWWFDFIMFLLICWYIYIFILIWEIKIVLKRRWIWGSGCFGWEGGLVRFIRFLLVFEVWFWIFGLFFWFNKWLNLVLEKLGCFGCEGGFIRFGRFLVFLIIGFLIFLSGILFFWFNNWLNLVLEIFGGEFWIFFKDFFLILM